ncbi:MAG TPA: LysM domain-containing protein [Kofleriaceae bacterium]
MKCTAALVVLLALVHVAHAQGEDAVAYRMKPGDTLELIAAEFYGDRAQTPWIAAENKLTHGKKPQPGDRIKVPITREIVTAKGDSFESLAATYLGDAGRAAFLADANSISIEDSLAVGTTLLVPVHVTYVAQAPESLAQVAQQFLGDAKQAELLRQYNNFEAGKSSIDKGEPILVPGPKVRVRAGKLPALDGEAKTRRDQQHAATAAAAAALPRAQAAWLRGDFAGVRAALGKLVEQMDYFDAKTAVELGVLLGRADVAFGDTEAAVAVFAQVLNRKPRHALEPYAESPKVIAAWQKAGGRVENP